MSKLAVVGLVLVSWLGGLTKISHSNELKKEAQAAYAQKNYARASTAWSELLELQFNPDPAVRLNLAHALRLQQQNVKAAREYQQVVKSGSPELQSVAHLQLGNLLAQAGEHEQALNSYKAALKANAANNHARYNYELLKKYLDRQGPDQEQETPEEQESAEQNQPQNQPQQGGGQGKQNQPRPTDAGSNQSEMQQGSRSGGQLGQHSSETDTTEKPAQELPRQNGQKGATPGEETSVHRLEQIRMTEERAKALLDAMRRAELQYLQQVPRRHQGHPDPTKPAW